MKLDLPVDGIFVPFQSIRYLGSSHDVICSRMVVHFGQCSCIWVMHSVIHVWSSQGSALVVSSCQLEKYVSLLGPGRIWFKALIWLVYHFQPFSLFLSLSHSHNTRLHHQKCKSNILTDYHPWLCLLRKIFDSVSRVLFPALGWGLKLSRHWLWY